MLKFLTSYLDFWVEVDTLEKHATGLGYRHFPVVW